MKRIQEEVVVPVRLPGRTGVSRRPAPRGGPGALVLSTAFGLEALRATGLEGARARDFEDFVSDDRGPVAGRVPLPDPAFREGLRRRLWRIQVLARRGRGLATH